MNSSEIGIAVRSIRWNRVLPALGVGIGAWLSVALISYGLALKSYAGSAFESIHINHIGPTDGKVSWVRKSGARLFGVHLKIQGFDITFHVPPEFVRDEESWAEIERSLSVGTPVWLKAYPDSRLVVQMAVNFRSTREKPVVFFDHVESIRPQFSMLLREKGSRFVFSGVAILPLLFLLLISVRSVSRLTKRPVQV